MRARRRPRGRAVGVLASLAVVLAATASCGGGGTDTTSPTSSSAPAATTVRPAPPFEGTTWRLEKGSLGRDSADVTITARFSDGKVGGTSGCNAYSGTYAVGGPTTRDGTELSISPAMESTTMACEEPVMRTEAAYLTVLGAVSDYRIEGGELRLFQGGDADALRRQVLVFEAIG